MAKRKVKKVRKAKKRAKATKKTRAKRSTKKVTRKKTKRATKKKVVRKTAKRAGRKKTAKKKVAKKKVRKTTRKKAKRKVAARKTKAKRTVRKKTARKKTAKKITKKVAKAAKPKRPRRTKHAPPVPRVARPPVVDVTPVAPPPTPQPPPAPPRAEPVQPVIERPSAAGPDVGDNAPDFELPDENGQMHSPSQYRGQKVVLYFYPKDDTPGCTTEACGFRDRLSSFTDRNAVVLGISPDPVESHQRFAQKYGLTFPLLVDEGHAVAQRYGVWVEKERYGAMSMGIARTTFLIGVDGRITHVFRDVRPEGHEQEVLSRLWP